MTSTVVADQLRSHAPSTSQLTAARAVLDADGTVDTVIVSLVTPGKRAGIWVTGQIVVQPPAIFPVRMDDHDRRYLRARRDANAVSRERLHWDYPAEGGTYGHAWIWRITDGEPIWAGLYSHTGGDHSLGWAVFEEGEVEPH